MDFKVRIRTDTPLFFLHKKLKERHGRMNELKLYVDNIWWRLSVRRHVDVCVCVCVCVCVKPAGGVACVEAVPFFLSRDVLCRALVIVDPASPVFLTEENHVLFVRCPELRAHTTLLKVQEERERGAHHGGRVQDV